MGVLQLNKAYAEQFAKDHKLMEKYAMNIDKTLDERGARYGKFKDHATISQALKDVMQMTDGWARLSADQAEALEMIQHKVARILNGDPNYHDSWHDIGGYSKLVADRLIGIEK